DDNIILLPREDTTQTELALDTGENGSNESVTNEFMLRLDNLTADLEDATEGAGAVNPFDETTRQLASSISHAYVPTTNKGTSTFSDNGTHVELTAACDSDKVAFWLNGYFSLGFRIKEGVPDETVMDNTITMGADSFSFVLKDKTDDIVVSTFGPALTTEKIIDTNGFHFRMSFDFQKRFIDCEIKQGHVYAIYMQGSAQLSIEVDNYQWSDLFESDSNIYTWTCNCQFYDYTPVYKVGFILPEPEEDEEGNTIDNAARVLTDVEWERKLDYRTIVTSEGLQEGTLDGIKNTVVDTTPAYRVSTNGLTKTSYLGVYVFGSYDGRKWALLGANEKTGRFRDIGCHVSHTDVKFLMFAIAGNLKGSSRIDYTEMSSTPSVLNTKIR
ncbi:MAG: hypothetical protein IKO63_06550, partial [Paludibacteraceae bacterium]|nr:hypothetical protein [Paludibacteraceae bacterium]